jgi:hypothetical protein
MVDDRNKTQLTKDVTAAAALWLQEHGFKPIETEVHVKKMAGQPILQPSSRLQGQN